MTSSISWEATDAISWNPSYVYVCFCALNMFKTIYEAVDCEIRSVIRFLKACWAILLKETRYECPISHLNQNRSRCTGSIPARRKRKCSSRRFQLGRSCAPYSLEGIIPPKHNYKLCCLLCNAEESEECNSKQKARNAECHHSFASR